MSNGGWTVPVPVPVPACWAFKMRKPIPHTPYPSNALRQAHTLTLVAFLKIVGLPCLRWQPFFDKAFF